MSHPYRDFYLFTNRLIDSFVRSLSFFRERTNEQITMNILAAIFPLKYFQHENNPNQRLNDCFSLSSYPWSGTCLLRGDADQCFRALLFQAAISYASIGKHVTFYTPSPLENFPSTMHGLMPISLESANLHLIQFHYLPTLIDAHRHLERISTDVVIFDGYLEYPLMKSEDRFQIIATCAFINDTYHYLKMKSRNNDFLLLCSCTCPEPSMANVEQLGLFDMAMDIEMCEDGDYNAVVHHLAKRDSSCQIKFRLTVDEIFPLSASIETTRK